MGKTRSGQANQGLRLGLRLDPELAEKIREAHEEVAPLAPRSAVIRQLIALGLKRLALHPGELCQQPTHLAEGACS